MSSPAPPTRIAVLGAGSWGTALAVSLAREGGHDVALWARTPARAEAIRQLRRNEGYLPGVTLPEGITVSSDPLEVVDGRTFWVVAVPSQAVRSVAERVADAVTPEHIVVSVAKGIENETLLTTSAVLREALPGADPGRIGVLYGPSHAEEVAAGQPASVVASLPDKEAAMHVQSVFMAGSLRVYVNCDLVGVEVGGSVKNVMALAAGMVDGLGFGDNVKAALVTRGLAEIKRLGVAMGANPLTLAGLAGLGDLVVTCFSRHSRNRGLGETIGAGASLEEALKGMTMVAEGVRTTESVHALAQRHGVEMPITEAVYGILFRDLSPEEAVTELMARDPKEEFV